MKRQLRMHSSWLSKLHLDVYTQLQLFAQNPQTECMHVHRAPKMTHHWDRMLPLLLGLWHSFTAGMHVRIFQGTQCGVCGDPRCRRALINGKLPNQFEKNAL